MRGAAEGAPEAQQVLDRYHGLRNMREVVQRIVSRSHATLKQRQRDTGVVVHTRYKKKRRSSETAASEVARLRRLAWYKKVVELYRQGKSIAAIAEELQMSPITVRKFVYAGAFPERSAHKFRETTYRLTPYLPYLEQRVAEGCENASLRLRRKSANKDLLTATKWSTHGYEDTWASRDAPQLNKRKPDINPSWRKSRQSQALLV